jgi:uncharacterized protein with HEPN domain
VSFKDAAQRLEDMADALGHIASYTETMDEASFLADERTQDAVSRQMEILGEAAARVPGPVQKRFDRVPWGQLAEMRNVLIHEYHAVEPIVLWRTVTGDLPPLRVLVDAARADLRRHPETDANR